MYLDGIDFPDCKLIMAIAQEPFENAGNRFATLIPLLWIDGTPANRADFRNNGLVWWKVPEGFQRADPGRLMSGRIEPAPAWENSFDKSRFQARYEVTDVPRAEEVLEIIDINDPLVLEAKDILARGASIEMSHPPTAICLARFGGHIYGPLRASAAPDPQNYKRWKVALTLQAADRAVIKIPESAIVNDCYSMDEDVSLNSTPPDRSSFNVNCVYEVMLGSVWNKIKTQYPREILESDVDVINKIAKTFSTNSQRRQLMALLKDLEPNLPQPGDQPPNAARILATLKSRLNAQEELDRLLATALLSSGVLDARIREGIELRSETYIAESATKLSAEIQQKVTENQGHLSRLVKEQENLQDEIDRQRRQAKREVDEKWETHSAKCQAEEQRLDDLRKDVTRMQREVTERLEDVIKRFSSGRKELINDFLALSPLLSADREVVSPAYVHQPALAGEEAVSHSSIEMPAFVTIAERDSSRNPLNELDFFERFVNHARSCNMNYRKVDLVSFHLSAKTSGLTILGGPSGTGKSSLPLLYSGSMGGSDGAGRYLQVSVSPSWLDIRDVIGHVNALERRFEPAESGLYTHLIYAQSEFENHSQASGIYLVCLDEMNLSHVEHYFSGFLSALEMPQHDRRIPCFHPMSVSANSSFSRWASLVLPPTVRFVGTVNFDETTKQISLRVKDRANLIRLRPTDALQTAASAIQVRPPVVGPPVTLRDFRDWDVTTALDVDTAELIDGLDRFLRRLGCPISPRRREAMRRFITGAHPDLCSVPEAFDFQIAQRLLPQVRGLFRADSRDALDGIEQLLTKQRFHFNESLAALEDLRREEYSGALLSQSAVG